MSWPASVKWDTVAAWIGALVACGALVASWFTVHFTAEQVELERKPVLILTGQPAFLLQEKVHGVPPPSQVLFLEPGPSLPAFNALRPFDSKIPTMNAEGLLYELPPLYARFALMNGGRVPVVQIKIPVTIFFYPNPQDLSTVQQQQAAVGVPFLAPGETFNFAVANASTLHVRYEFSRKASLTRIDTEKAAEATVFADDGVANQESQILQGYARREWKPDH